MTEYEMQQHKIAKERQDAQKQNLDNYYKRRQEHVDAIAEESRRFADTKTQLEQDLRHVLIKRAELRRQGLTNNAIDLQNSFAEEEAIHQKQRYNRVEHKERIEAHHREIAELHNQCCGTGSFITERALQQLKELDERYKKEQENA